MPCCATSSATVLVKPARPCFAATYADLKGLATSACAEAMLTMRPQRFFFIAGSAARVAWKAEERLMAMIASHLSTGNSSTGATCWMPALFTSTSTAPKRFSTRFAPSAAKRVAIPRPMPDVEPVTSAVLPLSMSERLDVRRRRPLLPLRRVVGDLLALFQRLEARALDRGVMAEQILAAVVRRDESEALRVVEPLHGTGSHVYFLP